MCDSRAKSATQSGDGDPKHKCVQDQQHDRRKGPSQRVSNTHARGDAQQHGEREASGGDNKHGAVEIAHYQSEPTQALQYADQDTEPSKSVAFKLNFHVRGGDADDPVEQEGYGRQCAGDFEGGLHRGGGG